ncbi:CNH-domain-containing protein [Lindgomyces ingoldianus]|uniref:CNH-domain-containing protein n=1 Tax=Lindgomyces ingoldianus TaxID=673940 RepID=A0ACB6QQZ1_9PLEO|nr:CNH-domain-containing protein [Lindgomyces ingoldianus]KAF2469305.1 CNH-domain-containing protein [Lindgomyces ingoldianus]
MAEYGGQQGREYARPPNYGHPPSGARDAAFASIFGANPAMAGRSQTMTSQPVMRPPDRAQTMSTQTVDMMQRAPPIRQAMNGYDRRPPPIPYNQQPPGNYDQQRPQSYDQPPDTFSRPPPNGYTQQRHSDGAPPPIQRQPQPQYLPRPLRPERQPYGQPQRLDSRVSPPGQHPFNKPMPPRFPGGPGGPGPALNSDTYRSQSLAGGPRPQFNPHGPNGPGYGVSPAHTFRQQPYMNHMARTTAQGRVVPERPDERTMSMSSYSRDNEYAQTMSGRVIPNRRRESGGQEGSPMDNKIPAGSPPPVNVGPGAKTRNTSQGSIPSRTMSMASTVVTPSERTDSMSTAIVRPSSTQTNRISGPTPQQQAQAMMVSQRRAPLVYPALLSRVAEVFRDRVSLAEKEKDGLVYKSAFTGAEAVDLIAYIIKTTDRNLALLLGRSLDAQKFFHDVTYAHRLRDSTNEIYQFRETLLEDTTEVNGVFTLLTECYSPTCTRDRLCYSIACPRRLEQQARLNMKPQLGLKRAESRASLHDDADDEQKLWINTVSKEVAASVSEKEQKRQEVISELMYTERDFVKDLEYLRDFWMKPLRSANGSPIPEHRREKFVRTVFSNCQEVYMVNSRLAESLTRRQQKEPVVRNIGDIFMEYVPHFSPFIKYGSNQLFGKYEFEHEKRTNIEFSKFVDEVERMKESRKLELNGYLTKPTTRLARYPLLLENILKYTADDNPDKQDIPKAIVIIKQTLSKVNIESGKAENHFNLMQLNRDLKFRPGEFVDLKLTDENRQLVFKGMLKKSPTDTTGDITCYLFDHAVLLVRIKTVNKREEQKVYKKPIPLELLVITQMDEIIPKMGISKRPSGNLMSSAKTIATTTPKSDTTKQQGYPITFKHLGKGGYELTLFASTPISQQKWMEHIETQQRNLRERSNIFTKTILNEGFFSSAIRVTCAVPIDGGRKLVFGTEAGIFVVERRPKDASFKPRRVLDCKSVTQVDVLEQHQIVLVLADKTLYSYAMEALDPDESQAIAKRPKKICHANFFKAGICLGQQLVASVKTTSLSTTIKVFEPKDSMAGKSKKSGFAKMLSTGQDQLKSYKEFYIPTESSSIHFLRSKLCVGCARGFEVVSLETLETQSLLDQADTSLDFVARKENIKPIHIERMASEFLLCYTDYSFFVNRNGWRARADWKIAWEGNPQAFAIFHPYILAFEPSFIEIRHMDSGGLIHIVTAKNIRMLHSSTREILYAYEDEIGNDVIASLDFWQAANAGGQKQIENNRSYEKS